MPLIHWVTQNLGTGVERLSAQYPILLLPVRLETRFYRVPTPELRIRVFPDVIFADTHEPELTEEEISAGQTYWNTLWDDPASGASAWRTLVGLRRAERAAWIVKTLQPSNWSDPPPPGEPNFPPATPRSAMWTKAPQSRLLPDRWTVIAYRGGAEVRRVIGAPIPDPLYMGFRPDSTAVVEHDGLQLHPDLLWLVDFTEAEQKGMGLRMPLASVDLDNGFDRLLAFGVKSGLTPEQARTRFQDAIEAHHHTRGMAFVRQGTPTNNSSIGPTTYPPSDDPDRTFAVERGDDLATTGTDGAALARALGIGPDYLHHVDGAEGTEQANAQAMNQALWPCTLGYYLQQVLHPVLSANNIDLAREHFEAWVRGRGPLPAFRLGGVPYGVLPVSSVQRWTPGSSPSALDTKLPELLRVWRAIWLGLKNHAPRVGKTSDPDADLLAILGLDAAAREVRLREVVGQGYLDGAFELIGNNPTLDDSAREYFVSSVLTAAGLPGENPRLKWMTFDDEVFRFAHPIVAPEPLSETAVLTSNYILEIQDASIEALRMTVALGGSRRHHPLLYHLLRQSALVEYNRAGLDVAVESALADDYDCLEIELVGISPGQTTRKTPWGRFASTNIPATSGQPLGEWLLAGGGHEAQQAAAAFRAVLAKLALLPTAELDRLVTETLDSCSHRLDAWLTSIVSKRLESMRAAHSTGVHLGAFGWVENLVPVPDPAPPALTAGGFIHAPSPTHAVAAAVLRNAYLTRVGDMRENVRVDLSSRRVRNALALLDGVRQGQPPGALLGYRFERALHDRAKDVYIERFRRLYPLGLDPAAPAPEPTEEIAARDVVNGLTLRAAWREAQILWGQDGLPNGPPTPSADYQAIVDCLELLDEDIDATADLLTAESVFQAVRGNIDRAGATLATIGGNGNIPEPEIVAMPAAGTNFTQRVALVLGEPSASLDGWPTATPRATAEPRLNDWLATLFGSPDDVRCRVTYPDPTPEDPNHLGEATVKLSDLQIQPLDFVHIARRTTPEGGTDMDARVEWYARAGLLLPAPFSILYETAWSPTEARTFPEAIEVARQAGELLAGSRPLSASDLVVPGAPAPPAGSDDLLSRGEAAATALGTAYSALVGAISAAAVPNLDPLREALWANSLFGISRAVPGDLHGTDAASLAALVAQGNEVLTENQRRQDAASLATTGQAKLAAVFGEGFVGLPRFTPDNWTDDIANSLDNASTLLDDALDPVRWFQQAARVRSPLSRLRMVGLIAGATAGTTIDLEVAQLPYIAPPAPPAPPDRWVALRFDPETQPTPKAGRLSLVLSRKPALAGPPIAGLLIDEWVELIPGAEQTTAFAVHHDAPAAEAPQTALLAVPPTQGANWESLSLIDTLHETLDLAKIRSIDAELLGDFALLAPCVYCAGNVENDCVSNDLGQVLQADPVILPTE